MKSLSGKVAIITGASSGIGAATARALAREGCHVALAARRTAQIDQLATDLTQEHPVQALAVPTDITDRSQIEELARQTLATFGRIDILVNNAGLGAYGDVAKMPAADLRHIFDVNVFGAVDAMQIVAPIMRRQGDGVIVNVSSILGKFALPQLGVSGASGGYASTKFALQALSSAARMELAADGIHVVTFCPGRTATEFDRNFRFEGAEPPPARKALMPAADPDQVARRLVEAIRRGERETYVSRRDRLMVSLVQANPALFEWVMREAKARTAPRAAKGASSLAGALLPTALALTVAGFGVGAIVALRRPRS